MTTRKEHKERCEQDLYYFCEHLLGYKDLDPVFHGELCRMLTNPDGKLSKMILLPRGHLKSSIATIAFPMWLLVNNPERTIAIINWSEPLVRNFLREMKHHFLSPRFIEYWPDLIEAREKKREVWNQWALKIERELISRTPSVTALSIEANITGQHFDVMIFDDVVNSTNVQNSEQIQKVHEHWKHLQAVLEPPDRQEHDGFRGLEILIGTRWHFHDLYNTILTKFADVYDIMERSCCKVGTDLADDNLVFPKKMSKEFLEMKLRKMEAWHFSAQYYNTPVDSEHAVFPPKILHLWKGDRDEWLKDAPVKVTMAIDPAWGTEGSQDRWGIVTIATNMDGHHFILSAVPSRLKPEASLKKAVAEIQRWKPHQVVFESMGGQDYLRVVLKRLLDENNMMVSVLPLKCQNVRKEIRIQRLIPWFESKRLYIHNDLQELYTELVQFPRATYRDLIDSLEMAVWHARAATGPSLYDQQRFDPKAGEAMREMKKARQKPRVSRFLTTPGKR